MQTILVEGRTQASTVTEELLQKTWSLFWANIRSTTPPARYPIYSDTLKTLRIQQTFVSALSSAGHDQYSTTEQRDSGTALDQRRYCLETLDPCQFAGFKDSVGTQSLPWQ